MGTVLAQGCWSLRALGRAWHSELREHCMSPEPPGVLGTCDSPSYVFLHLPCLQSTLLIRSVNLLEEQHSSCILLLKAFTVPSQYLEKTQTTWDGIPDPCELTSSPELSGRLAPAGTAQCPNLSVCLLQDMLFPQSSFLLFSSF